MKDTGQSLDGALLLGAVLDGSQPGQHALQEAVHGVQRADLTEHAHTARRHVAHRRVRVLQAGEQLQQMLQQLHRREQ